MSRISVIGDDGDVTVVRPTNTAQVRVFNTATVVPAVINLGGSFQNYVFDQIAASTTWNISHNLGRRPSVTVVNSAGKIVVGDVTHNSDNSLTIQFSSGLSGQAYLN